METKETKEIDLAKIDWSNLKPENFNEIEKYLQKTKQFTQNRVNRKTGFSLVNIAGKTYEIKSTVFEQLIKMKSEKPRINLINKIVSTSVPLESL